ncbi:MAG: flagellar basal body-associated FliL family protein [Candidatus Lokiarchaeota archaeon]|nr:flagellar basal body-associated FliL family protein [Candidatus Lokiarchaeota archaeon]
MSDQENIVDEELDLDEGSQIPQKKGPFLSPLIIRILLIVALFIVITLIAIIVFIVGSKFVSPVGIRTRVDEWGEDVHRPKTMHLEYIVLENPFRQQLLDGKMIQLKITLAYKAKDKKLQQEISSIIPEIRDIIIKHLSRLRSDDFTDISGTSLEKLEDDFLKQINRILNNGKIERILFQEYTLM